MSNWYLGVRGAAGRATPLVVLRCVALLAVLMWVLPVCAHSADTTLRVPAASAPDSVVRTDAAVGSAAGHECPESEHGPGDAHCRSAEAVTGTTTSVPVPSPQSADVTTAVPTLDSPPARGAPGVLVHTPGIHHLQIQRI
ncbi:hypothetical protein OHA71_12505 [Streptomyces sp. NBC_00444]|uniref:hypothetical protein n=1 Tax=Streptomyces sp. NBC_00444 TaxID=2975744 RepID=UPI002E215DE1